MSDAELHGQSAASEAFMDAVEMGDEETVLAGMDRFQDAQNMYGLRPLHLCVENSNLGIAKTLVDNKANVSLLNDDKEACLHTAAKEGALEFVQVFLAAENSDVNIRSNSGATPLHLASYHDRIEAAQMLVDAKADLDAQNANGDSALHFACWLGRRIWSRSSWARGPR
jgi:ankyrin repeat protein